MTHPVHDLLALSWLCIATLTAQAPGLGEEALAIDVQTKVTGGLGSGPWQKFCGVVRDSAGNLWAVAGHPLTPTVPTPGKLVKLDAFGTYLTSFDQPVGTKSSSFGIRDLAYDPATSTIWGGWESSASGGVIWSFDLMNTNLGWSNDTSAAGRAYLAPPGFAVHRGLAFNPVTKTMWVANFAANPLTEFDRAGTVLATIPIGNLPPSAAPYGLAIDPTGTRLWVYSQGGSTHTRIDTAKNYEATGFNVLIEIDIDKTSQNFGKPTGVMTLGSGSGGAVGGVPPNPVYQTPIAGGAEASSRNGRLELVLVNQGQSDHISILGAGVAYGKTCGGAIGVAGDAPYSGNSSWGWTLRGSSATTAILAFGLAGPGSLALSPPITQPSCTLLLATASPGLYLFPAQTVLNGSATQLLPIPATLTPLVTSFQWVEIDPTAIPPVRLSDGGRAQIGLP